MLRRSRLVLALSALVVVLAACGTTVAGTPEPTLPPTPAPSEPAPSQPAPSEAPSEAPAEEPEIVGRITIVNGGAVGGPGASIAETLATGAAGPVLVNGILVNDGSGTLLLASSMTDGDEPSFGGPMLEVVGYPESPAQWDMANADVTGLQEVNGVLFFEDAQLFGTIES